MLNSDLIGKLQQYLLEHAREQALPDTNRLRNPWPLNLDSADDFGCTALMHAAMNGHSMVVKLLTTKPLENSKLEHENESGTTKLHAEVAFMRLMCLRVHFVLLCAQLDAQSSCISCVEYYTTLDDVCQFKLFI